VLGDVKDYETRQTIRFAIWMFQQSMVLVTLLYGAWEHLFHNGWYYLVRQTLVYETLGTMVYLHMINNVQKVKIYIAYIIDT
jgi:hypothetical protein